MVNQEIELWGIWVGLFEQDLLCDEVMLVNTMLRNTYVNIMLCNSYNQYYVMKLYFMSWHEIAFNVRQ